MKKIVSLALCAVMLVMLLAACGGSKTLSGTYTITYNKDDLTSNTFHNGFLTAVGDTEKNTITFSEDGTYVYTKDVYTDNGNGEPSDSELSIHHTYTFSGTYSVDGSNAILNFPTKVEWSENWGPLNPGYLLNTSGSSQAVGSTRVQCKEDESHDPFDIFESPFLQDELTTSAAGFSADNVKVTVTINDSDKTFTYVIVNTDDD